MNKLHYLLQFFKDPKVAAVGPTSRRVVEGVCDGLPFDRDIRLLELGPGDGAVTRKVLDRLSSGSRVLALETNESFYKELASWDDPRLTVIQDRAENFLRHMEQQGFKGVDHIISGIPSSMLSHEQRIDLVMNFYRSLEEGGTAMVYQLSPLMKKYIRNFMELEDMDIKMNGLLPMFLMKGRKKYRKDPVERTQGAAGSGT
ncbi:MAG: class I SAM-dependent methyltransferase [Flavobacteriales bacterium]